jgi:hypothetical protein
MEVSGQHHASEKDPWYPLDKRLAGPQSMSGCCGVETFFLSLPRIVGHPAHYYRLQIWRVAGNALNRQLRRFNKGWASSLWVGHGAKSSLLKKRTLFQNVTFSLLN